MRSLFCIGEGYSLIEMLVTLGLLAEMQARTYHESQNKPIYVIRDVLDSERSHEDEVVHS